MINNNQSNSPINQLQNLSNSSTPSTPTNHHNNPHNNVNNNNNVINNNVNNPSSIPPFLPPKSPEILSRLNQTATLNLNNNNSDINISNNNHNNHSKNNNNNNNNNNNESVSFHVLDHVKINGKSGIVRFVGLTKFAPGTWVGIELGSSNGKNDGSIQGVRYFNCAPKCGLFAKPQNIKLIPSSNSTSNVSSNNLYESNNYNSHGSNGLKAENSVPRDRSTSNIEPQQRKALNHEIESTGQAKNKATLSALLEAKTLLNAALQKANNSVTGNNNNSNNITENNVYTNNSDNDIHTATDNNLNLDYEAINPNSMQTITSFSIVATAGRHRSNPSPLISNDPHINSTNPNTSLSNNNNNNNNNSSNYGKSPPVQIALEFNKEPISTSASNGQTIYHNSQLGPALSSPDRISAIVVNPALIHINTNTTAMTNNNNNNNNNNTTSISPVNSNNYNSRDSISLTNSLNSIESVGSLSLLSSIDPSPSETHHRTRTRSCSLASLEFATKLNNKAVETIQETSEIEENNTEQQLQQLDQQQQQQQQSDLLSRKQIQKQQSTPVRRRSVDSISTSIQGGKSLRPAVYSNIFPITAAVAATNTNNTNSYNNLNPNNKAISNTNIVSGNGTTVTFHSGLIRPAPPTSAHPNNLSEKTLSLVEDNNNNNSSLISPHSSNLRRFDSEERAWLNSSQHKILKLWVGSWNMGSKDIADITQIEKFIPLGYDIIVIGVQECVQPTFFDSIESYLKPHKLRRLDVNSMVAGRGDGSFIRQKYTGICCFVSSLIRPHVRLLKQSGSSLGLTEGSKGGAAFLMKIYDKTFAFVSVHMSSRTVIDRRNSYTTLIEAVGNSLGDEYFQLLEQFHHLIWLGDCNYRIQAPASQVIEYIKTNQISQLMQVEELKLEMKSEQAFLHFHEADILFHPTYKKKLTRPLNSLVTINKDWPNEIYNIAHKQPWYKSGNVVERVPSYCDRILYHSANIYENDLKVEMINSRDKNTGKEIKIPNYQSHDYILTTSDHSAVSCAFLLRVKPNHYKYNYNNNINSNNITLNSNNHNTSISNTHNDITVINHNSTLALAAESNTNNHLTINRGNKHNTKTGSFTLNSNPAVAITGANPGNNNHNNNNNNNNNHSNNGSLNGVLSVHANNNHISPQLLNSSATATAVATLAHTTHNNIANNNANNNNNNNNNNRIYSVKLIYVRLLIGDIQSEPKYIRVLFPAPYEINSYSAPASKVVYFQDKKIINSLNHNDRANTISHISTNSHGNNHNINNVTQSHHNNTSSHHITGYSTLNAATISAYNNNNNSNSNSNSNSSIISINSNPPLIHSVSTSSNESNNSSLAVTNNSNHTTNSYSQLDILVDTNYNSMLGEFCIQTPGDPRDLDSCRDPEIFHFLLKVHTAEGLSGQCSVCLLNRHFTEVEGMEFLTPLTRNGINMIDTKGNKIAVQFRLECSRGN